jgi:hypothetical protein
MKFPKIMTMSLAAASFGVLAAFSVQPAQANPAALAAQPLSAIPAQPLAEQVQYRGRGYHRGYNRGYYRGRGPSGGAVAAGVLGGLALGAAIGAANAGPPPAYYAPGYGSRADWLAYCSQRYRSFDPASGTFMGYDGIRRPCT